MLERICHSNPLRMLLFATFACLFGASVALAQTTSFTYQGHLADGGTTANGLYDFQFTLWDAASNRLQQPQPTPITVTLTNVSVAAGVFSMQLDFGASAFPGANRFLEIGVRPAGNGSYTILTSRQQVTSTPYAGRSLNSGAADNLSLSCVGCVQDANINSVAGSKVSGAIPVNSVPAGSVSYVQNTTSRQPSSNFNISGNGTLGGSLSAGGEINTSTYYDIGGSRALSVGGSGNVFAGVDAGRSNTTDSANLTTEEMKDE